MKFDKYSLDLPITTTDTYQQLYKGTDTKGQSYYITKILKEQLNNHMYDQIVKRINQYNYIKEVFEDEENIVIIYKNSEQWQRINKKITNSQLNQYFKELYWLYSYEGQYDFNPELIYINNNKLYILDYGIKYLSCQQQQNNTNQNQYNLLKTWLFGTLIYCITTGCKDPSQLIKCNQKQIDFFIEYNCRQNNISEENISRIKLLLRYDINIRPQFDELQNLDYFKQPQLLKNNSQIITQQIQIIKIENKNEKQQFKFQTNFRNQSSNSFYQNQHYQQVKLATRSLNQFPTKKNTQQQKQYVSPFKFASQSIKFSIQQKNSQKFEKPQNNQQNNQINLQNNQNYLQSIKTSESFFPKLIQQENNSSALSNNGRNNNYSNLQLDMKIIKEPTQITQTNIQNQNNNQSTNFNTNQIDIKPKSFNQKPKYNLNSFEQAFYSEEELDQQYD